MTKLFSVAALLALAIPASRAADDDAAKVLKKLEGTYEVTSAVRGGKEDPSKEIETFTIKDGVIAIKVKDKEKTEDASITVDPSKKPAEIDITPERNGNKQPVVKGIYAMKEVDAGLELTLCFRRGKDAERPKDFKGDDPDLMVIKLLRKKAK